MKFQDKREELQTMVESEIKDIEYRIEGRDHHLFGSAGPLDSVSEYCSKLGHLSYDIMVAVDSDQLDRLKKIYIEDFPGV